MIAAQDLSCNQKTNIGIQYQSTASDLSEIHQTFLRVNEVHRKIKIKKNINSDFEKRSKITKEQCDQWMEKNFENLVKLSKLPAETVGCTHRIELKYKGAIKKICVNAYNDGENFTLFRSLYEELEKLEN